MYLGFFVFVYVFRLFCLFAGERVLCFHGPLLYEAKVSLSALGVSY